MKKLFEKIPLKHPIGLFAVKFVVIYLFFVALLPAFGIEKSYDKSFHKMGEAFFSSFKQDGKVRWKDGVDPNDANLTTMLILTNANHEKNAKARGGNVPAVRAYIKPWDFGYLPVAVLIAMILATPFSFKDKKSMKRVSLGALGAMTVLHLVIWFKVWITLLYSFNLKKTLEVVALSEGMASTAGSVKGLFAGSIVLTMAVPVLIWWVFLYRKEDF